MPTSGRHQTTATAALFGALGDETRLGLVSRLSRQGPLSISELADGFPLTRQAITKHLRVLERAGVVQSAAQGREVVWRVEASRLASAQRQLEQIAREWHGSLRRLNEEMLAA